MKRLRYALASLAALLLFLGIPGIIYAPRISALLNDRPDAVSSASLELPAQPSGEFLVLLNAAKHPDTLQAWADFFGERDTDVIFEDLHCLVIDSDAAAIALAERFQARLAEHQMTLRRENATLAASRVQWGVFDVLVISGEMAALCSLETACVGPGVRVIEIRSGV